MSRSVRLPDAMPDVSIPTLLVVCDSHHCRLLDVGDHAILEKEVVRSREPEFTDRQDSVPRPTAGGKGGSMIGVGDTNQLDTHRLQEFAHSLTRHLEKVVRTQKIESVHLSAPGKFLSLVRDQFTPALQKVVKQTIDGNYVKEHALDLLVRFRPDLKDAVQKLRDEENYGPGNRPPKKQGR